METTKERPVRKEAKKKQTRWWKKTRKELLKGPRDTFSESTSTAEQSGRRSDGGGLSDVLNAFSGDDLNVSSSLASDVSEDVVGKYLGHVSDSSDISAVTQKRPSARFLSEDEEGAAHTSSARFFSEDEERAAHTFSTPVRGQHDNLLQASPRHQDDRGKENQGKFI